MDFFEGVWYNNGSMRIGEEKMKQNESTHAAILSHLAAYPRLQIADLFKFLYQSTHGCEHMIASPERAIDYIKKEAEIAPMDGAPIMLLDGAYSRVFLSYMREGLCAETFGRLFCLSAKQEEGAKETLEKSLAVLLSLAERGELPFEREAVFRACEEWKEAGYPAIHHSDEFRAAYRPAYRVIANEYIPFLSLFARLDAALAKGRVILAIEGGSASGKSTLASLLAEVYGCTVFHMDDFFLRPEQRTPARLAEVGGNVDRERFLAEVLTPLCRGESVFYRPYDCATGEVAPPTPVTPGKLVVVEGVYSMHPALAESYDLSVFLDISPDAQMARIEKRNSPAMAERFFREWIPLETRYFEEMRVCERCDVVIPVTLPKKD